MPLRSIVMQYRHCKEFVFPCYFFALSFVFCRSFSGETSTCYETLCIQVASHSVERTSKRSNYAKTTFSPTIDRSCFGWTWIIGLYAERPRKRDFSAGKRGCVETQQTPVGMAETSSSES